MPRRRARWLLLAALAVTPPACGSGLTDPLPPGDAVLFIGNSLTYYNAMPDIVKALADSSGEPLRVGMVAFADFALVDHWYEGTALEEIGLGGWRYVVLQQGPSAVSYNRDSLRLLTTAFAARITAVGARPALYSVWPSSQNRADFPASMESYRLAAADVDGLLLPVAAAWLAAWNLDPTLQLYSSDGLHPTPAGSYLAALVIYARIFDRPPTGLPASMTLRGDVRFAIDPATASVLQNAALSVTAIGGAAPRALSTPVFAPPPRR